MSKKLSKWIILVLSFIMILGCVGCTQNGTGSESRAAEKKDVVEKHKKLQKPVVDYTTLETDKPEVTSGEKVKVSVKIKNDVDMENAYIYYMSGLTKNLEMVDLKYNKKTNKYEGYIEISESSEPGTWKPESILTVDSRNKTRNVYNSQTVTDPSLEHREDLSIGNFTVKNTAPEYNAPEIDMSTLKVSKTKAKVGDKIKVSVKITDQTGIEKAIIVYKKPELDKTVTIKLKYNKESDMMEGYYAVTEESESGKWTISYIIADDTNFNSKCINNQWGNEEDMKYFVNGDFVI
ncbi:hypothetical protein [Intestinibacter sp.]